MSRSGDGQTGPNSVPSAPLRVVVATARVTDRVRIIRVLCRSDGFAVIGEAGDGRAAVRLAARTQPDLVLLDASLPSLPPIDATAAILHASPGATVVVLTTPGTDEEGRLATRFGASAFAPLDGSDAVLMGIVTAVMVRIVHAREAACRPTAGPPSWWRTMGDGR